MNKFNKGKLIGVVAASLSAVSLMGVGFATWVLQGPDEKDTGDSGYFNFCGNCFSRTDYFLRLTGCEYRALFYKILQA